MVLFPNCKINIGLNVTSKRADGYHDIATIFYPLHWYDAVEAIPVADSTRPASDAAHVQFTSTGLRVPGATGDNICLKAYQLLKKDFPALPAVAMHLHKSIPTGAGLGGGSSDGAFTLLLLNKKFRLNLSTEQLLQYALTLGSDCPFFIINRPCYATGRGEQTTPLPLDLSAYSFLIVYPGIHISTAWAFSQLIPAFPSTTVTSIVQQPVETWKDKLINDFELPVFRAHPPIEEIKKILYANGALYASLTGSGSAVYGIFSKNKVPELQWDKNYIQKIIQ